MTRLLETMPESVVHAPNVENAMEVAQGNESDWNDCLHGRLRAGIFANLEWL